MTDSTETSQWGSFALVSYIPDPLGSFLHGLLETVPGEENAQPHITILPPRPLTLPVDAASEVALKTLLNFSVFEVELSKVCSFPGTNVLYLDLDKGNSMVRRLHSALNLGTLRQVEKFTFLPHLTLAGPLPAADLQRVRIQAESAWRSGQGPRSFLLDEIVFLWLSPEGPQRKWTRLWSHKLSTKETNRAHAATAAATSRTY